MGGLQQRHSLIWSQYLLPARLLSGGFKCFYVIPIIQRTIEGVVVLIADKPSCITKRTAQMIDDDAEGTLQIVWWRIRPQREGDLFLRAGAMGQRKKRSSRAFE